MANTAVGANTVRPNGGFLSNWTDTSGSGAGDPSSGWTDPNGNPPYVEGQGRPALPVGSDPNAFQTAGGHGGGFVNYSSWLLGNSDNQFNQFLNANMIGTNQGNTSATGAGSNASNANPTDKWGGVGLGPHQKYGGGP